MASLLHLVVLAFMCIFTQQFPPNFTYCIFNVVILVAMCILFKCSLVLSMQKNTKCCQGKITQLLCYINIKEKFCFYIKYAFGWTMTKSFISKTTYSDKKRKSLFNTLHTKWALTKPLIYIFFTLDCV